MPVQNPPPGSLPNQQDAGSNNSQHDTRGLVNISTLRRKRTILRKKVQENADMMQTIEIADDEGRARLLVQSEVLKDERLTLEKMEAEILSHPNLRDDEVERELEEQISVADNLQQAVHRASVRGSAYAAQTERTQPS